MTTTRHRWTAARVKYIDSPWALSARLERELVPTRRTRYTDFLIDHAPPPPALLLAFGGEYGLRRALDENREMVWRALEELEAGPPCREARA